MPEDKCKKSIQAASEIISEEACQDGEFVKANVGNDGMLMWVPEGALEHSPHSPENETEREEAVEACMGGPGSWSYEWAEAVVGAEASEDIIKRTQRKLCEGLYSA